MTTDTTTQPFATTDAIETSLALTDRAKEIIETAQQVSWGSLTTLQDGILTELLGNLASDLRLIELNPVPTLISLCEREEVTSWTLESHLESVVDRVFRSIDPFRPHGNMRFVFVTDSHRHGDPSHRLIVFKGDRLIEYLTVYSVMEWLTAIRILNGLRSHLRP